MPKFLVTYLAPASVIEEWKKTNPEKRKAAEEKMRADWVRWMTDHAKSFTDKGAGVGKTKKVTSGGTSDTKNEIMLYGMIEAELASSGSEDVRRPSPFRHSAIVH